MAPDALVPQGVVQHALTTFDDHRGSINVMQSLWGAEWRELVARLPKNQTD